MDRALCTHSRGPPSTLREPLFLRPKGLLIRHFPARVGRRLTLREETNIYVYISHFSDAWMCVSGDFCNLRARDNRALCDNLTFVRLLRELSRFYLENIFALLQSPPACSNLLN
jgi:hypothetical protein